MSQSFCDQWIRKIARLKRRYMAEGMTPKAAGTRATAQVRNELKYLTETWLRDYEAADHRPFV
jgi:hypothetical protein